ncbi:MAG: hypothetical protein ABSF53_10515 [Terracidiphilus sp.]|jgi:hypothetical protein
MSILLQPWSLLLFAVVMFFVFFAMGAKEDYKPVTPLTRWIMAGLFVAIVAFGVIRVFKTH